MEERPSPPGLAITGWLCTVSGGLLVFGGLLFGLVGVAMRSMREQGVDPLAQAGVSLDPMSRSLLAHPQAVAGVLVGLGAVSGVLGVQFLRRRPWARPALELPAWFVMVASLAGEGYLLGPGRGLAAGGAGPTGLLTGPAASLITTLLQVVACVLIIRYLRSAPVRAAFRGMR